MKKTLNLFSIAVATSALAVVLVPALVDAEAAKVLDVEKCTIIDGNGNFYSTTAKNKAVYNKSGDILKCDAKGVPNDAQKTVHYDKASTGYRCGTGQHQTDDWHQTVSASGNATLTCKFKVDKPNQGQPAPGKDQK